MSHLDSADASSLDPHHGPEALVANRYQLVRKVGVGGMGTVWLAHDQALDAPCAVKLVNDELASNKEVRARFTREAKLAAQLRSPHVVHVFDCGESNGTLFIVMEWLEGESLASRIDREGNLDAVSTYRVVAHVARALTTTHALGVVHRDLKPDNVFLVPGYDEETAKVLDFGIARDSVHSLRDRATREGSFLGTPCYLSPEQARGKPADFRADLWALGVMAFECLTGHSPFDADAIGDVMGRILYEPLPKPSEFNAALPAEIDEWWLRAASRDPEQRFQSAKELTDALGKALGLEQSVTVPPPARARTSSFPDTRASGIYSPAIRERPEIQTAEREVTPENGIPKAPRVPAEQPTLSPEERQSSVATAAIEPAPAEFRGYLGRGWTALQGVAAAWLPAGDQSRVRRWLWVGLPVAVAIAILASVLWPRHEVVEPSATAPESTLAPLVEPPPQRLDADPEPTESTPVIRLENLPRAPVEETQRSPQRPVPGGAAVRHGNPPVPAAAPSTRDYGI
jgi:serine/threonine protein kinase